ncbi:hypothetical protein [Amycolatopsis sp. NPDC004378]
MSVTILRLAAPVAALALACAVAPAAHASTITSTCSQADLPLPDPACTPGALNPDVTQASIGSTICVSGWTATIRPRPATPTP